jgi:hypothetical protein
MKIDVVIQGKYFDFTQEVVNVYREVPFINNIIISCWENDNISSSLDAKNIKIIKNKYPGNCGVDNKNLQIVTSLNGLKCSNEEFAIKTRSDQKYTYESLMAMYDFFSKHIFDNINKIFVAGVYPELLFSPRDHIFWGTTKNLLKLFDIPLEKNNLIDTVKIEKNDLWKYYDCFVRTETYIGSYYCSNFDNTVTTNKMIYKSSEYLYDNAPNWGTAKQISDSLLKVGFKSFPKNIINFEWLGKWAWNIPGNPWYIKSYIDACSWHEEGF